MQVRKTSLMQALETHEFAGGGIVVWLFQTPIFIAHISRDYFGWREPFFACEWKACRAEDGSWVFWDAASYFHTRTLTPFAMYLDFVVLDKREVVTASPAHKQLCQIGLSYDFYVEGAMPYDYSAVSDGPSSLLLLDTSSCIPLELTQDEWVSLVGVRGIENDFIVISGDETPLVTAFGSANSHAISWLHETLQRVYIESKRVTPAKQFELLGYLHTILASEYASECDTVLLNKIKAQLEP